MATNRSLVVIDEFGKGTNVADGVGLCCGVLDYFNNLKAHRPKVLAATHFHEIFENNYLLENSGLSFGHMEVRMNKEALAAEDQITYLYNFLPGRSTSSFGTICAKLNGIDTAIVKRAENLITLMAHGGDLITACTKTSKKEAYELEEAERVARKFLEQNLSYPEFGHGMPSLTDIRSVLKDILVVESSEGT